jgi:LytS/YehU family sensor histidine kinase
MHLLAIDAISILETTRDLLFFVSFVAIILYLFTRTPLFTDFVLFEKRSKKGTLKLILLGSALGILASEFGIPFPEGTMADIRLTISLIFGVIGGPWVGIPVGLASGLYRLSGLFWEGFRGGLGYRFAIGGFISTFGAGILGGILHRRGVTAHNVRKNTKKILLVTILWCTITYEIICPLTAALLPGMGFAEAFYISNQRLFIPEMISDVFAIMVFSLFLGGIVTEEMREVRKLRKLVERYSERIGPEAQWIARDVEKDFEIERMIEKKPLKRKKKGGGQR